MPLPLREAHDRRGEMIRSLRVKAWIFTSILTILLTSAPVFAQRVIPRIDPTGRSGDRRPDLLESNF